MVEQALDASFGHKVWTMEYEVLSIEKRGRCRHSVARPPRSTQCHGPGFLVRAPTGDGRADRRRRGASRLSSPRRVRISAWGLDLKTMGTVLEVGAEPGAGRSRAARSARARVEIKRMQQSVSAVAECPKPIVAAVHGYCIGGGVDLVSACDIRFASEDAAFSVRETKMAIVADLGSLQRLPRIIGAGHVAELAFTGKDISAARAKEIGLVNEVLPDADSALKAALAMAAEIAANSPLVVQGTKAVIQAADAAIAEGLDMWRSGTRDSSSQTT